jgi:hypothetical protein
MPNLAQVKLMDVPAFRKRAYVAAMATAGLFACASRSEAQEPNNTLDSLAIGEVARPGSYELRFDERMGLNLEDQMLELVVSTDLLTWEKLDLNRLQSEGFDILRSTIGFRTDEHGAIMERSYVISQDSLSDTWFKLHWRPLTERISYELIRLDEQRHPGIIQSWDNIGMDDQENVYFGFTTEVSPGIEDMNLFRYNQATGTCDHLGSYIQTLQAADNYLPGESVPKGHTYMPFINGKLYMGSQGFHDFKGELYEPGHNLNDMRGSHIFTWDVQSETLEDLSKDYPGGVATENEGILSLSMVSYGNHLFGLTHPFGNIVFLNHTTGAIDKIVPGIPWSLGNPISREVVVSPNGNIYLYRGTEKPDQRHLVFNVYQYNIASDTLTMLDFQCTGGFWSGQTITRDQKHIYIITVQGELYHLDTTTETWEHWGNFLPDEQINQGAAIRNISGITLDAGEQKIYGIIGRGETGAQSGDLIEYNLATKTSTILANLGPGIYTGNNTRDAKGHIYFNRFGDSNMWREYCGLLKIHIRRE